MDTACLLPEPQGTGSGQVTGKTHIMSRGHYRRLWGSERPGGPGEAEPELQGGEGTLTGPRSLQWRRTQASEQDRKAILVPHLLHAQPSEQVKSSDVDSERATRLRNSELRWPDGEGLSLSQQSEEPAGRSRPPCPQVPQPQTQQTAALERGGLLFL